MNSKIEYYSISKRELIKPYVVKIANKKRSSLLKDECEERETSFFPCCCSLTIFFLLFELSRIKFRFSVPCLHRCAQLLYVKSVNSFYWGAILYEIECCYVEFYELVFFLKFLYFKTIGNCEISRTGTCCSEKETFRDLILL